MPESNEDKVPPSDKPIHSAEKRLREAEHLEDEEKVLAGRADANIPAMLTKDVPGG